MPKRCDPAHMNSRVAERLSPYESHIALTAAGSGAGNQGGLFARLEPWYARQTLWAEPAAMSSAINPRGRDCSTDMKCNQRKIDSQREAQRSRKYEPHLPQDGLSALLVRNRRLNARGRSREAFTAPRIARLCGVQFRLPHSANSECPPLWGGRSLRNLRREAYEIEQPRSDEKYEFHICAPTR